MAVKITIITVCHNAAKTIQQTIESVVEQDYGNIEYIIVDGRSTDDTPAIVSRYKQYVAKYIYEKDDGIYDAMNKGIQAATGTIYSLLALMIVFMIGVQFLELSLV